MDALETRALELELQVADLTRSHNRVVLSHRIFDKIRVFGIPPVNIDIQQPAYIPLFPWTLPSPDPLKRRGIVRSEQSGEGYEPVVARSTLDELFKDWRPEEGTSDAQSVYL